MFCAYSAQCIWFFSFCENFLVLYLGPIEDFSCFRVLRSCSKFHRSSGPVQCSSFLGCGRRQIGESGAPAHVALRARRTGGSGAALWYWWMTIHHRNSCTDDFIHQILCIMSKNDESFDKIEPTLKKSSNIHPIRQISWDSDKIVYKSG